MSKQIINKFKCLIPIILILIAFSSLLFLASCHRNNELYKPVTLEVYHPVTGEIIAENKIYRFEYDGNPKIFTLKVKLDETGKFLEDKDFENNNWKSHIKLLIRTETDDAYIGYDENGVFNFERDWPQERGYYNIMLSFNDHGWLETVKSSEKYAPTWFYFNIEIT